jgi:DNA-directed RNA polymerase beta subunit
MTIGQFYETMSSKIGLNLGTLVDSTPFTATSRLGDLRDSLLQMGYHPYGHELLYNGMTGEMMEGEIFMGPVYYLRLKHMVEDKINYRTTGPRTMLTHQPLGGRADGGGLRIGEMERDSLVAHGISKFLNESLMDRADAYDFLFQPDTGRLDASGEYPTTEIHMPYAMRLFLQEMEAMHIQTKLASP